MDYAPGFAFALGYRDGLENPVDLGMGLTWERDDLNEAYDRGVNAGQKDATDG